MQGVEEVVFALDWTPNINHCGFFLAQSRGYYEQAGVRVCFKSPHTDGYKTTPAQQIADGSAHIAVCPSESVISYACQALQGSKPKLKAVAAVLDKDTSAIVTLGSSGITRPKELSGKRYGSYGARYEGRIVQRMILADGGSGEYTEDTSMAMLDIWDTLVAGKADATWVFLAWEGVMAQQKGLDLNVFKLDDFNIPYGYSPALAVDEGRMEELGPALKKFLAASARGWEDFVKDPAAAAAEATAQMNEVFPELSEPVSEAVMVPAAQVLAPNVLAAGAGCWGKMDSTRWDRFIDWLSETGLLTTRKQSRSPDPAAGTASLDDLRRGASGDAVPRDAIPAPSLFTNDLLPSSEAS